MLKTSKLLTKVWHPYWLWEDLKAGMWRKVDSKLRADFLKKAVQFTGNHETYGSFMQKVVFEWPLASEHNLTDTSMNRLAWIGHAACCLAINCPEDITRQAWAHLSQKKQDLANQQAQNALNQWEQKYESQNSQLCLDLET